MIKFFCIILLSIAVIGHERILELCQTKTIDESEKEVISTLTLSNTLQLLQIRNGLFIDTRSFSDYNREHIRGAVWLEDGQTQPMTEQFISNMRSHEVLIIYCESNDTRSEYAVSGLLKRLGFENIYIYTGGFSEWKACGLPTESK